MHPCLLENKEDNTCYGDVEHYEQCDSYYCFGHRPYTKSTELTPAKHHYGAPIETDLNIVFHQLADVLGWYQASLYFNEYVIDDDDNLAPFNLGQPYHIKE